MAEEGKEIKEKTELTKEAGSEGLSLRDALEVGIQSSKESEKDEVKQPAENKTPKEAHPVKPAKEDKAPSKDAKLTINPPAEWSKEEQEDFKLSSPKQQEATLRLYNSRLSKLSEIQKREESIRQEAAELQWAKDIVKEITPFLKTRGDKEPTHAQVIKALKVVNEVDANTKGAVAEILKAKGIPVPKELLEDVKTNGAPDEKIIPLQKELDEIKSKLAQQERAEVGLTLHQAWTEFEQTKNAAGSLKFPDADNTEAGMRLASNIGSLVGQQTELSKQFVAMVRQRIPNATYQTLLQEAYRYCGGKVDDSEAPRTQDTQKHIVKSSRAAASVPGRGSQSASNGTVKKFKTYREAAAAALADIREREGA